MKKTFRAAVAMLFALVFAVVGLSAWSVSAVDNITPEMFDGTKNLALNKTAFASSVHSTAGSGKLLPKFAVDGITDTDASRWQSALNAGKADSNYGDSYLGVDLGKKTPINSICLLWEASHPDNNQITIEYYTGNDEIELVTSDNSVEDYYSLPDDANEDSDWKPITAKHTGYVNEKYNCYVFDEINVRYVRVFIDRNEDSKGCDNASCEPSIYEFEVYNKTDYLAQETELLGVNLALNADVTASTETANNPATKATDGDEDTHWTSDSETDVDDYIIVDLGEVQEIAKLRVTWGAGAASNYSISIFDEPEGEFRDVEYTKARTSNDIWWHEDIITFADGNISAQYVKITTIEMNNYGNGAMTVAQIYEFQAFGPNVSTATKQTAFQSNAVNGVKNVFVATNVNKDEVPTGIILKAKYTITSATKGTGTGVAYITGAYAEIAYLDENGEPQTVNPTDIGADENDYITGVLFTNVPADAKITVSFAACDDVTD